MEPEQQPSILCVDKLENSLLVTFDDGKFGVFSAHLLREALSEFDLMDEAEFMAERDACTSPKSLAE